MEKNYHIPVLLDQSIELLNIKKDGIYVDATFGGGGHSKEILKKIPNGKLIAFDTDQDAQKNAFDLENFILINSNFIHIPKFLRFLGIDEIDGILVDLGVSSYQIDTPQRGFSYRYDYELDMRMNKNSDKSAKHIINNYSEPQLTEIFSKYGEVFNSKKLASLIVKQRKQKKINTVGDFLEAIKPLIPKKNREKYLSKVFQALRIEVNNELENLKILLSFLPQILKIGGRAVIISYHSLEDRLVKNFFKYGNFEGKRITDFYGNQINYFKNLTKKPVEPSVEEIKNNSRSRSAKLRAVELIAKQIQTQDYETNA